MSQYFEQFLTFMQQGGFVMWPLLALSILTIALSFERAWFWISVHGSRGVARYNRLVDALRRGQRERAMALAQEGRDPYSAMAQRLLNLGPTDPNCVAASEEQRPKTERYLGILGTIVTASPLLGILGTVTGIIKSFALLGGRSMPDPTQVSHGIAEALVATASGLTLALFTLFPYMIFRAQAERSVGRTEMLIAAMQSGFPDKSGGSERHDERESVERPKAISAALRG